MGVEYYTEREGRQPVAEWLKHLDDKLRAVIRAKIDYLEKHGLELLDTEMLKTIRDGDKDFYELRGGQGRIATYYDRRRATFVLLHGFLKKRGQERREIQQARRLLHRYLSMRGG